MEGNFYNGNRLIQTLDLDKQKPEIFMVVGNRTAGKTFFFKKKMITDFKRSRKKFVVLKRLQDDLYGVSDEYFKDLEQICFPGEAMTEKSVSGAFTNLYLNGEHCGYAMSLNGAERVRARSSIFSDVEQIHFDEFQSEGGRYVPDEINKFQSIHTSIARGKGKHVRYVPVYMTSNAITMLNPYYEIWGIGCRLRPDTKILRGHGWVLEHTTNQNAAAAISESGFGRAFANSNYMAYALENVYLDDKAFITSAKKRSILCNIRFEGKYYGIYYTEEGFLYVDDKTDEQFPFCLSMLSIDHNEKTILTKSQPDVIMSLRQKFSYGIFRFRNLKCKEVLLQLLSVK